MQIAHAVKRIMIILMCIFLFFSMIMFAKAQSDTDVEDELVIGIPTDRCPIFFADSNSGRLEGIGVDLISTAAAEVGYYAVFKPITEKTLKEALDNPEYDIIMPFGSPITSASGKKTIVSDNLMNTPFTLVTTDDKDLPALNQLKIGMLSSLAGGAETIKELYPGVDIEMYETMNDLVKALRTEKVDALMHNSYVWSYVLQKPSYSDLVVHPATMFSMDFRAGTIDTENGRELISRLNKGIENISDTRRQAIILDYTSRRLYQYSFWDKLYIYKNLLIIGSFIFWLLVIVTVRRYISVRKAQEQRLRNLIEIDPLTGVLTLEGFKKRVEELLRTHPDNQYLISFNNIKNFKYVNESLGRDKGDELLRFWAEKTLPTLSDEEAMGRIMGDRFVVLRKYSSDEQMKLDEREVFEPLRNYFLDKGKEIQIQTCTGVYALVQEDYKSIDVDRMLDYARIAEKKVHNTLKSGYEFYNPEQWERGKQVIDISGHLPSALKTGEIKVWYHPQVDYDKGVISGAEALCRWKHAKLGWISPGVFIPILEETGLIYELDSFVWDLVCQDLHRWNEQGIRRSISVNLSRSDIREDRNLPNQFFELIQKYNLDPEQLRIEITETAYVENPDLLIKTTQELRDFGFQVEMDDFGSGYSSLHMLKEVPVDRIKMDLHFLSGTGDMEKSRIIITQVIQLVNMLGMKLIAEGVETQAQADFLKNHGCREMQGYYFYKPMPVEDFEKLNYI